MTACSTPSEAGSGAMSQSCATAMSSTPLATGSTETCGSTSVSRVSRVGCSRAISAGTPGSSPLAAEAKVPMASCPVGRPLRSSGAVSVPSTLPTGSSAVAAGWRASSGEYDSAAAPFPEGGAGPLHLGDLRGDCGRGAAPAVPKSAHPLYPRSGGVDL